MKHFVIATAGHVDHGKSSLVKALTGTDPDRLPEEKARQITIDLGFAELNLGAEIHAAIVDVPGHEDFVRNMIAGVGSIDLALLVVAADDGWMPQTEEHLQILTYLRVERAVIALTKIDIGDAVKTQAQIQDQLRETNFSISPIIPVSVRNQVGLEDLRHALASELSKAQSQRDIGKPRLFVDRAFTLHGIGTVATGTLTGGTLRRGDTVIIQPRNLPTRIRSIQTHGRDVDLAQPGTRTAINLPDLSVGDEIARGDVVTMERFEASSTLDVVLHRSPRLQRAMPIKSGASVHLHHGTMRVSAKVILLENETLRGGEEAIAQLRLSSPILAFLGDRFVIRDASEQHTIAGGIVLNPDGDRKNTRAYRDWLRARAAEHDDVDLCVASEVAQSGPVRSSTLLRKSRFSVEEVNAALQQLHRQNKIFLDGEIAADIRTWQMFRDRAIKFIDTEHETHPERVGIELSELRAALHDQSADVFEALVVDLCGRDFIRVGSAIARRSHRPALPVALKAVAEKIRASLSDKPFDPPTLKETDPETRKVIRFLIQRGELVELAPDVILSHEAFVQMKEAIARFLSTHGPATVSQLRQELGTSRRIIVPLLERLDREGLTRRVGDQRTLAKRIDDARLDNASTAARS